MAWTDDVERALAEAGIAVVPYRDYRRGRAAVRRYYATMRAGGALPTARGSRDQAILEVIVNGRASTADQLAARREVIAAIQRPEVPCWMETARDAVLVQLPSGRGGEAEDHWMLPIVLRENR